ncbi:MAG: hypothetical protein QF535_21815, partial [Anaerolineales bacterium]|jgi:hypothetical protein|nr:hypothetical protein [Anaerolineales bacterium]
MKKNLCEITEVIPIALHEEYYSNGRVIIDLNDPTDPDDENIAVLIGFKSSPNGYTKYLLTNHSYAVHLKFKPGKMKAPNNPNISKGSYGSMLQTQFTITNPTFSLKRKPYPRIPTKAQIAEAVGRLSE